MSQMPGSLQMSESRKRRETLTERDREMGKQRPAGAQAMDAVECSAKQQQRRVRKRVQRGGRSIRNTVVFGSFYLFLTGCPQSRSWNPRVFFPVNYQSQRPLNWVIGKALKFRTWKLWGLGNARDVTPHLGRLWICKTFAYKSTGSYEFLSALFFKKKLIFLYSGEGFKCRPFSYT
jgi:hypothetical protein